jgi:hypothetical protein
LRAHVDKTSAGLVDLGSLLRDTGAAAEAESDYGEAFVIQK